MFERAQLAAAFGLARWQRGHTLERGRSTSRPDRVEVRDLDTRQSTHAQRDCDHCDAHACPVHTLAHASVPVAVTHTSRVSCSPCAAADRVTAPTPRARAQAPPGCTARPHAVPHRRIPSGPCSRWYCCCYWSSSTWTSTASAQLVRAQYGRARELELRQVRSTRSRGQRHGPQGRVRRAIVVTMVRSGVQ